MHPMLNIAIRSARMAGNLIIKNYDFPNARTITQAGKYNFGTNIDRNAECLIIDTIHKSYPHHIIINAESSNSLSIDHDIQWIINPLDCNTNFIKNFPHFSVSIAVRIKDRTEVAVVYDPMRNELFTATRGQGAQLNGYRLRCTMSKDLDNTILATSYPYTARKKAIIYFSILSKLLTKCTDFRCTGVTSLDLAYVAAGRVDGLFEICLKSWKFIGGELLVREAGGLVTDFLGDHNYLKLGNIIAGNPRIVKAILANVRNEIHEVI
ncbi:Inositol-1-monophosphatase [Candidatus Profftia lariciata]|uniref:inositol-1-monophosphatase n=1 Tax=Candidatus Profftia lariciata TaxID=1987921 RepID=UPI001D02D356|nr:inositol-1-monophosphatase [Candidatus Profftia lariciata]UDG81643.1 Inositol-1-monophosphatase [Candidatus Profftia lariciata]